MDQRKPNRLKNYDYSQNGYYFVTICTRNRQEWFGIIENGEMKLNENGKIAERIWREIPGHFVNIELDEFVVMPNHIHGIICIKNTVGNRHACSLRDGHTCSLRDGHACSLQKRQYQMIPVVVGSYKSAVTRNIRQIDPGNQFHWQKSFYDHVIRDELSLNRIREYIKNNPRQWDSDRENIKNRRIAVRNRPACSVQEGPACSVQEGPACSVQEGHACSVRGLSPFVLKTK